MHPYPRGQQATALQAKARSPSLTGCGSEPQAHGRRAGVEKVLCVFPHRCSPISAKVLCMCFMMYLSETFTTEET